MAEGFDDYDMKDIVNELESYGDDELNSNFNEITEKKSELYRRYGDNEGTPDDIKVKYREYDEVLGIIKNIRNKREERNSRDEKDKHDYSENYKEAETSFINNDNGETMTIKKLGDPIEAPSADIITTFKRNNTNDKRSNISRILGMDHHFRVKDGKYSKKLIENSNVIFSKIKGNVIGLDYNDVRIYVGGDKGKSYRQTTNKGNKDTLKEFESVRKKAEKEYRRFEEEKQKYPLIETVPKTDDIKGLTPKENSELRGVMSPSSSIDTATRTVFLKVQADHFQETIDETKELKQNEEINSLEKSELSERVIGLEEAKDRTLEQLETEETREKQEEDISRLVRFKEWIKENWLGASAFLITLASLLTTKIIATRSVIVKGAQGLSKFSKAIYKTFRDIAKKLGPIIGPVFSAIGSILATVLKYGAMGIAWLAQNLWVLVIAIALFIYERSSKK